jgi:hypothetical protein
MTLLPYMCNRVPTSTLTPFLQYPLMGAPSSSSLSHSLFFFNTKLSTTKIHTSLDLILQCPSVSYLS